MKNLKQGSYIKIILDEADEYAKKDSICLEIDEVIIELKKVITNNKL